MIRGFKMRVSKVDRFLLFLIDSVKDPLHFFTDFEVFRILLGTIFRTPQLVHFDQISLIGKDPFLGSDLPVFLVLDMHPFLGWAFFSE